MDRCLLEEKVFEILLQYGDLRINFIEDTYLIIKKHKIFQVTGSFIDLHGLGEYITYTNMYTDFYDIPVNKLLELILYYS